MIPARTTPWQALYQTALFIGPLVENCIEIVKRDQVEALAWAKQLLETKAGWDLGAAPLPPFRSVRNTDMRDTKFPWLIIEPEDTSTDERNDGAAIGEGHAISIELAITGKNPELMTRTLFAYVLAVHMMLTSAGVEDMLAGYTSLVDVTWEVKGHQYSRSTQSADETTVYQRAARMTLAAEFSEVQTDG